jgi:L-lactate dehydrogenase complex protein LldG
MQREPFLAELSARLGRPRPRVAPERVYSGAAPPEGSRLPLTELRQRFRSELELVGGEVLLADSHEEARAMLLAELRRAAVIVTWARSELTQLSGLDLSDVWRELGERCHEPSAAGFRATLLRAEVGVTAADFAIAETGTLVLSAEPKRPRAVSLAPRLHIALLRESQLVTRRSETWARYRPGMPSALLYITGPSRTSDIENDLSIGVHGPARVLVIVLPEAEG